MADAKKQGIITGAILGLGLLICLAVTFWLNLQAQSSLATVSFLACDGVDADVILIRAGQHFAMIDTGESVCESETLDYLKSQGVTELDFLLLSHPDKDHLGNAVAVLEQYPTSVIYASTFVKDSNEEAELLEYVASQSLDYRTVTEPLTFALDTAEFTIVPPVATFPDSNNMSLITTMTVGDVSFLFTGDIEKDRIAELLKTELSTTTILKLPHHGRYKSNLDDLLAAVQPEFAIVSATAVEEKTSRVLTDAGIEFAITTKNLVISTNGKTWKLR